MNNKSSNFFNENTFTYDSSVVTTAEMRELADFIRAKVSECKRGVSHSAPQVVVEAKDPVEEIKKYKELLDMGIITDEEFQIKKKELLGL